MPASFFTTGKYDTLYSGTKVFSTKISATPTVYGLTAAQATAYAALSAAYVAAYDKANAPATRTTPAIIGRNDAAIPLRQMASDLAKIVEGTPTVTNEQKADLGLSVRATPTPMPPPGTASGFKVELLGDGSVRTTWKANNPIGMSGVTYQVWRRFGSDGEFTFAGASGEKKYIDSAIPAGTQQVQYQIRGIRPTAAGGWAQYNVNFGMAPSGQATASGVETKVSPKLAA